MCGASAAWGSRHGPARPAVRGRGRARRLLGGHTCHIIPPSEIDLGLFWAHFTDLEGNHLFHRIG